MIAEDVQKINDIYRDLSYVIHSQTEYLDRIEENMTSVDKNVEKGTNELARANSYHKSLKSKEYKLFGIVFTIASVLGLGLGFGLKK